MPFEQLPLKMLKEHAKANKDVIKGYSKMEKESLVKLLKKHLKINKKGEVTKKESKKIKGGEVSLDSIVKKSVPQLSVRDRVRNVQNEIDRMKGGQLPSSIRGKLEKLEMDIKGSGLL